MYLLDTDTLGHFQRGNSRLLKRLAPIAYDDLGISVLTFIEVLRARFEYLIKAADARQLQEAQKWLDDSLRALNDWQIIRIDAAAASEFERLQALRGLKKIGRRDILIASIALANHAVLVTRNTRDFALVPNLVIENWVD